MDAIYDLIDSITPDSFNAANYVKFLLVFVIGMLVLGVIGRLIFGKRSTLGHAVSSSIAILFIFVVNVVIYSTGLRLDAFLSPLPYVELSGDYLILFNFLDSGFSAICAQVLNMILLAFLVNLLDTWLPSGKKILSWLGFRIVSVVLAICLQYVLGLILGAVIPDTIAKYAPIIIAVGLVLSLLLGALKLVVGGVLTVLNPFLGLLYAFFFSNLIGKQISKAMLTTLILTGLVCLLNWLGVTAIYIASAALLAYLPLLLIVLVLWFVVGHLL